jgi:hypothetical protein
MASWGDHVKQLEEELAEHQQRLKRFESGFQHSECAADGSWEDITQREIESSKRTIALYERLIDQIRAEHEF